MTPKQERHLRALYVWRNEAAKAEEATGEKMFLGKPERWFEDVSWGCTTGHVSRTILKCEEDGDRCLECNAPVLMIPPEFGEAKFGPVMMLLRTIAGICASQGMDPDETVIAQSHGRGLLNISLGAPRLVTGSAGEPPVDNEHLGARPGTLEDKVAAAIGLDNLCLEVPIPDPGLAAGGPSEWNAGVAIFVDDQGRMIASDGSKVVTSWEIGVTEITPPYAPRWTGEFVVASDEEEAERLAGERGYYRNVCLRYAARDLVLEKLRGG